MFNCILCERSDEYLFTSHLCSKCRKIKHYINIYDERVFEVLDNVLSRTEDKQDNKIKVEIKTEIENKEMVLRNKKLVKRGTEVDN